MDLQSGEQAAQNQENIVNTPAPKQYSINQLIKPALVILAVMTAIAVSEYIFAYRNVGYGITISLVLVIALYSYLGFRTKEDGLTSCLESLSLVPLYILFTSSLPWFFIDQQYLLPAVYSSIIGLCLLHVYLRELNLKELINLPDWKTIFRFFLLSIPIGSCTGLVEYLILKTQPAYPDFGIGYLILNLFYMIFFVGLGEEFLFRGLIQNDLSKLFGWKWGLFGTALLFSIMHLTWRSVPELFFVFIAGLIFGSLYLKTKSLALPILVHGINNTVLMAVYPYLFK